MVDRAPQGERPASRALAEGATLHPATMIGPGARVVVGARRRGGVLTGLVVALAIVGTGCGPAQPTLVSEPAASASVAPPPAATASRAPAASPTPAPGSAAIAAFVKSVTGGKLSYVATVKGRSRHTTDRLPVKGSISVSGRDYRVAADFTFDSGVGRVDHRYVDGKAWVRFDTGKWTRVNGFKAANSMSPFAAVTGIEAVRYLETTTVDGKTRHRVEIDSVPLAPSLIPAVNLTKETVTRGILTLLIDDAGRPVSGTARVDGTGRVSGQLQEVIIELTLTFGKVGQKVTVSAP
jgi:hypothetical protein